MRSIAILLCVLAGCGDNHELVTTTVADVAIDGLSADDQATFDDGDALFRRSFRAAEGLGPLYIRTACASCHDDGDRGPGLVRKMEVVDPNGDPAADQSALAFGHTIRLGLAAGATTPIEPPGGVTVKLTTRMGPPVLGRGYLEAIADSEIQRMIVEQAQRTDGIHGELHLVTFASVPNPDTTFGSFMQGQTGIIGRFGMKSRIATIDDFTADAFQGDMGMTTPMRPDELPNPDGLTDDDHPGIDLPIERIDNIAFYLRRVAIPERIGLTARGEALFAQATCDACHVPSLRTRADYPIAQLADIDAPVFTDMLLHDMGPGLDDAITDGTTGLATGKFWKTTPLIGLRFARSYLHDGRAHSIEEAILAHDGEAKISAAAFSALPGDDQRALLEYVEAL